MPSDNDIPGWVDDVEGADEPSEPKARSDDKGASSDDADPFGNTPGWIDSVEDVQADEQAVVVEKVVQVAPLKGKPASTALAKTYDFRRPNRVSKDRLRTIQAIFDRLISSLEVSLASQIRGAQISVSLSEIVQLTFAEYTLSLPKPCAAYIYYLGDQVGCSGILELGQRLPLYMVDRLFGGPGEVDQIRALSGLERQAVMPIANRIMSIFAEVWQDYVDFKPSYSEFEFAPEVLEIAHRDDPVLIAVFEVIAGSFSASFSVCTPIQAIERFLSESGARLSHVGRQHLRGDLDERHKIESCLMLGEGEVVARFPNFQMSVLEASRLKAGSVVFTGLHTDAPVEVITRGGTHFLGRAGQMRSHVAVRISEAFVEENQIPYSQPKARLTMPKDHLNQDPLQPSVEAVVLENFETAGEGMPEMTANALERVRDFMLPVTIELGRTTMLLKDILELGRGSVIQLDRLAGEPFDIYVSNRKMAEGEVVVLGEHFGIRITRVFGVNDRPEEEA